MPMKYLMISTVACEPDYVPEAFERLAGVMAALHAALPAVTGRFGRFIVGEDAGRLVLFHGYDDIADVEPAFDVYAASDDFAAMAASGKIALRERNLIRLEDHGAPEPASAPRFGLLTRGRPAGAAAEPLRSALPMLREQGAGPVRFGTLLTGSHAGASVLGVGYPSLDAIERCEAAPAQAALDAVLRVERRDLVSFAG